MSTYSEARKYHDRKQYEQAYKLYEQGAAEGDEKCYYGIALFLHRGNFVEKDVEKAEKIFADHFDAILALANGGDAEAMIVISFYYANGYLVEKNDTIAANWIKRSAESGNANGQLRLGYMYRFGEGVEKDLEKAVEWYRKSAEQGNSVGQWRLGYMYNFGKGVEEDLVQAVEWYRKSAEQENSTGQRRLGQMYEGGYGVEKDLVKAVELYRKSAEQGDDFSQLFLGTMYEFGKGVDQDPFKAAEWIRKSANQGNPGGLWHMGKMYEFGIGVEKDIAQAIDWYKKSAKSGHSPAQLILGKRYKDGIEGTLEPDSQEALKWWKKAAENEYPELEALYLLGYAYYDGEGVKQDLQKSLEYFERAVAAGYSCSFAVDMVKNLLNKNKKPQDNPMRDYANEIISKELPIKKMYPRVLKDLKKDFGDSWSSLQLNSQKFLSTSMVCYIALYSMGGHIYGNMDFTSCITPMFKALEAELAKYLYTGYINYLEANDIPVTAFKSIRSFIISEDGPYAFGYRDPNDLQYFTLGSLHLIVGPDRRTQERKGWIEIQDKETGRKERIKVNEGVETHSSIDKPMLDYAKTIFKEDAFGTLDRDRAITDYLIDLTTEIKSITDAFRNPAAHSNIMSYDKAEICANHLIKSKKLICKFIEKLKPEVVNPPKEDADTDKQ